MGASSSAAASIFSSAWESATRFRRCCSSPIVLVWEGAGLFNSIHRTFAIVMAWPLLAKRVHTAASKLAVLWPCCSSLLLWVRGPAASLSSEVELLHACCLAAPMQCCTTCAQMQFEYCLQHVAHVLAVAHIMYRCSRCHGILGVDITHAISVFQHRQHRVDTSMQAYSPDVQKQRAARLRDGLRQPCLGLTPAAMPAPQGLLSWHVARGQ